MDSVQSNADEVAERVVNDALSEIQRVLEDVAGSVSFSGSISYETNVLTVYVPSELRAALLNVLGTSRGPLKIRYIVPKFGVDELIEEGARIVDCPGVAWAGPNDDYSGMQIGVMDASLTAEQLTSYPAELIPSGPILPAASR